MMMQYGNVDVTLDIIRGIDVIRRGAHALSWGIRESGCINVLMPKIEMDVLRLSHIHDTLPRYLPDPMCGCFIYLQKSITKIHEYDCKHEH